MPGYLRLKVRELLKERGTNLHKAMQAGGFSYPTMHRYMAYPDQVESLHTPTVLALLIRALGYTADEIEALPVSHFFEVVTDGPRSATNWATLHARLLDSYLGFVRELNDPIIDQLVEALGDRLARIQHENDHEITDAERRAYAARVIEDRVRAWVEYGTMEFGEDPELRQLVQLGFIRLAQLAREAEE